MQKFISTSFLCLQLVQTSLGGIIWLSTITDSTTKSNAVRRNTGPVAQVLHQYQSRCNGHMVRMLP